MSLSPFIRQVSWVVAAGMLVAFGVVRDSDAAPCAAPPANLVSWWPGDGDATDIVDGNHGTLVNGATFATGIVGSAFLFDSSLEARVRVSSSANLNFGTGDFSVALWARTTFLGGTVNDFLLTKASVGADHQYTLGYAAGPQSGIGQNGEPFFFMGNGTTNFIAAGPHTIADGQFHHLAGVRHGTNLSLYVDGQLAATQTTPTVLNASSTNPVVIGGRENSTSDPYFDGVVDEVVIFARALTAEEVQAIHAAGTAGICKSGPPTANAGPNQTIHAGQLVVLDGSESFDDDTHTEELAFAWTLTSKPDGSSATLMDAESAAPSFVADAPGEYVVSLIVTDAEGQSSAPDTVVVSSLNSAPVADAGPEHATFVRDAVTLDGSASQDPDGDALAFSWTLAGPADSTAVLVGETTAAPTFTPDVPGTYTATLAVADPFGGVGTDSVEVAVVTAESFAESLIVQALNLVGALQPWQVTTRGNQRALQNFLSQAIAALQVGDLDEARSKVTQAIERLDGCVLRGSPDGSGPGRDWVTDCAAQATLYDDLTAALAALTP